ncbi:ABC transporter permease [Brevibacillus laterosporus]|uniref:ABC transporter permease n=1 Tax=Brevibacillus TaxID=55080 RepID=UPI000CE392BB|nr:MULTISPECIES: ABC transporter permease [Brevibacillus]MBG9775570.1 ABC transporter permease [Brevibacillus laterosporus]MBG9798590.1 ABC transporter permease [Brevibacillus laterosporus]MCR8937567.1 ABC transporter permease [Brevibacillus laterosporus]MCZ0840206.1 ABC transporter permease [Brevibacillus laterosporus]MCZ0844002.1 ABC transporter permease [Brevibacillus laterosporus]
MSVAMMGALEQGLLFAVMALGVYLTFRILNFPDLTVDGSFALGGAMAATLITEGTHPVLATFVATGVGALAGAFTGVLTTKGKINGLLAGILTMIALYSINLRIMGKSNVPLLRETTLYSIAQDMSIPDFTVNGITFFSGVALLFLMGILILKGVLDYFLHSDVGLDLRATGDNPTMIRSYGVGTDGTLIMGLALSNALVALSGALIAQYQGFGDVNMGIGMIIIGLASVIIGEVIVGDKSIMRATLAVIIGSLLYRFVIAYALKIGLSPGDMKLITALLVIVALTLPNVLRGMNKYLPVIGKGGNKSC